jgi:nicotinamide mononucleotide adenylyltransferase
METNGNKKGAKKSSLLYRCELCDVLCGKKSNYDRHVLTPKHKRKQMETKSEQKRATSSFNCRICNKVYHSRSGLWKHEKNCVIDEELELADNIFEKSLNNDDINSDSSTLPSEVVMKLIEKNNQLQEIMVEQNKQNKEVLSHNQKIQEQMLNIVSENRIVNNTTHNTQNNNFNLNFFLNEQCKNAMNISDFLNTVKVEVEDVANVGKLGYVEGISRIFMKALNNLDVYERPIHCSDLKREVMYIKDNGIWEKEGEEMCSMKKALQLISHRNVMKIKAWTDANPSWKTHYSKEEDEYLKISYESMGGSNKEEDEKYFNKIIRKVASNVTIVKNQKIG